jgi:hypothetical protein
MSEVADYLKWIDIAFRKASQDGLTMTEVMSLPIPKRFAHNALLKQEYSRSIVHLYAQYEKQVFVRAN